MLTIVGTPIYSAPGCDGPLYRSALVVSESFPGSSLDDFLSWKCDKNSPLVLGANSVDSFSVSTGDIVCNMLMRIP